MARVGFKKTWAAGTFDKAAVPAPPQFDDPDAEPL